MSYPPKIGIGMYVYFRTEVFGEGSPWYPYYEPYKGHKFEVTGVPYEGHLFLKCVDAPEVKVHGCIHDDEVKLA